MNPKYEWIEHTYVTITDEKREFFYKLLPFLERRGINLTGWPVILKRELDLFLFYEKVSELGGLDEIIDRRSWTKLRDVVRISGPCQLGQVLRMTYLRYLYAFYRVEEQGLPDDDCKWELVHPSVQPGDDRFIAQVGLFADRSTAPMRTILPARRDGEPTVSPVKKSIAVRTKREPVIPLAVPVVHPPTVEKKPPESVSPLQAASPDRQPVADAIPVMLPPAVSASFSSTSSFPPYCSRCGVRHKDGTQYQQHIAGECESAKPLDLSSSLHLAPTPVYSAAELQAAANDFSLGFSERETEQQIDDTWKKRVNNESHDFFALKRAVAALCSGDQVSVAWALDVVTLHSCHSDMQLFRHPDLISALVRALSHCFALSTDETGTQWSTALCSAPQQSSTLLAAACDTLAWNNAVSIKRFLSDEPNPLSTALAVEQNRDLDMEEVVDDIVLDVKDLPFNKDRPKEPHKPVKPKTAYSFYHKSCVDAGSASQESEIAQKWNGEPASVKQRFEEMAHQDKQRYRGELEAYKNLKQTYDSFVDRELSLLRLTKLAKKRAEVDARNRERKRKRQQLTGSSVLKAKNVSKLRVQRKTLAARALDAQKPRDEEEQDKRAKKRTKNDTENIMLDNFDQAVDRQVVNDAADSAYDHSYDSLFNALSSSDQQRRGTPAVSEVPAERCCAACNVRCSVHWRRVDGKVLCNDCGLNARNSSVMDFLSVTEEAVLLDEGTSLSSRASLPSFATASHILSSGVRSDSSPVTPRDVQCEHACDLFLKHVATACDVSGSNHDTLFAQKDPLRLYLDFPVRIMSALRSMATHERNSCVLAAAPGVVAFACAFLLSKRKDLSLIALEFLANIAGDVVLTANSSRVLPVLYEKLHSRNAKHVLQALHSLEQLSATPENDRLLLQPCISFYQRVSTLLFHRVREISLTAFDVIENFTGISKASAIRVNFCSVPRFVDVLFSFTAAVETGTKRLKAARILLNLAFEPVNRTHFWHHHRYILEVVNEDGVDRNLLDDFSAIFNTLTVKS